MGRIISSYIHTQTIASIGFLQSSSYGCERCLGPTQHSQSYQIYSFFPSGFILGFHSRDETAMLVYKTMAKCRSSFA